MKTKQKYSLLIIAILFMAGCIPSLHPLYHDKDRLEVPEIVGKWNSDDGEVWEFRKVKDEPCYNLTYTEKSQKGEVIQLNDTANIVVNIVKLGGAYFMDFYPGDNKSLDNLSDFLQIHLLAVHSFAKLEIIDGNPQIRHMDPDWLVKLFDKNKIRIKHEEVQDNNIVLTASTDDLQKFITKYVDDDEAFLDATVLTPYKE